VDPDVELPTHDVYVSRRIPVRAGVRGVRIPERDVDAGNLLILQNIADHVPNRNIRADGELAHAVAVLVGMAIPPEIVFQPAIRRVRFSQAIAFDPYSQWRLPQVSILLAEIIAHHAVDHERSFHVLGTSEGLAARQIAPFMRADDAAGLQPLQLR